VQYDAFPDGTPNGYGQSGPYWGGSGMALPYNAPSFTAYETGATVVGLLNNNGSHFQIHFTHFANAACPTSSGTGYADNGFDDTTIAGNSYASWSHMAIAANFHSVNNLNNPSPVTVGKKIVPAYSAHIISVGYSQGSVRVVEAMLKRSFFTDSSGLAGQDINIHLTSSPYFGDGNLHISSLTPSWNNVVAGISSQSNGSFKQTGGNVNVYLDANTTVPANRILFFKLFFRFSQYRKYVCAAASGCCA